MANTRAGPLAFPEWCIRRTISRTFVVLHRLSRPWDRYYDAAENLQAAVLSQGAQEIQVTAICGYQARLSRCEFAFQALHCLA